MSRDRRLGRREGDLVHARGRDGGGEVAKCVGRVAGDDGIAATEEVVHIDVDARDRHTVRVDDTTGDGLGPRSGGECEQARGLEDPDSI